MAPHWEHSLEVQHPDVSSNTDTKLLLRMSCLFTHSSKPGYHVCTCRVTFIAALAVMHCMSARYHRTWQSSLTVCVWLWPDRLMFASQHLPPTAQAKKAVRVMLMNMAQCGSRQAICDVPIIKDTATCMFGQVLRKTYPWLVWAVLC